MLWTNLQLKHLGKYKVNIYVKAVSSTLHNIAMQWSSGCQSH